MEISLNALNISVHAKPENPVRIGIVTPYIKPCWDKLPQGGECPNVDYETEFIIMLMRARNWNYVFVPTNDYGYQHANDSTQWNGLVTKSLATLIKRPF